MTQLLIPLVSGAAVAFWVCAPVAVVAAIGMVLARKAVHSALFLAGVMMCLAVLYAALDAPFLFVAQIIVYTGAILMLFLFVVMLVGVDRRDSVVETIRGQRPAAILLGLGAAGLLIFGLWHVLATTPVGLATANGLNGGNVGSIAHIIFSTYVFPFELTSALLIIAAVGTMVMAHAERVRPKLRQPQLQAARIKRYAATGEHPGALPSSGVFARLNAISVPALLPDGSIAEKSVSTTLAARGVIVDPASLAEPSAKAFAAMAPDELELEP